MKHTKLISIVLALVLTLSCIPFAFAEETESVQTPDCIKWAVSFDKEEYSLFDTALATITMTNTSEDYLLNVVAQLKTDGLKCSRSACNLGAIAGGVSRTFTVRLKLSSDASGLNFLARLLLKIHEFFDVITGKDSMKNADDDINSLFEARADFGWGGKRGIEFSADYDVFENRPDSIAAAVEAYNKAASVTTGFSGKGYTTLESVSLESLQGMIDMLRNVMSNNAFDETDLPGEPPLTADDVVAASLKSKNGKTDIVLVLKEQEDDYTGTHRTGDYVTRGIGTMGDFRRGFEEVGEFTVDPENTSVTYTYPVISVTVDDATGKIISGNWSYCVTLSIDKATLRVGKTAVEFKKTDIVLYYIVVL